MAARGPFCSVLSAVLLVGACSILLEPKPGEQAWPEAPARPQRRPALKPPETPPVAKIREETPRTDWVALREALPKDATGNVDWVRALNGKLIRPRPGLDPKAEDEPVLDLDVELVPKDAPDFKVTYPHGIHTRMLACANCHPAIFQMQKGADAITMEKIFAGEFCGHCHGKVAFDVPTGCVRCHPGMPR